MAQALKGWRIMSTDWRDAGLSASIQCFTAAGFPPPTHPAEPDLFARHVGVPGHDQDSLSNARVLVVGAGGLGSWVALGLARSGVRSLILVDPDRFDRTNAPRQLMFGCDLGAWKAVALARNLVPHMVAGGTITAIPQCFEDAIENDGGELVADVALFLVDNNRCRWLGSGWARAHQIPAVFAMLSLDGMRVHSFMQGPDQDDPCLWCALPNLEPQRSAPCAAGVIATGLLAAAFATFLTHRAVMGWPEGASAYNWREDDLLGNAPQKLGRVVQRPDCRGCSRRGWRVSQSQWKPSQAHSV